jgi:cytoskeletal protein CcmA (bactofilin family)
MKLGWWIPRESDEGDTMARDKHPPLPPGDGVISIIGPGMRVVGDLTTAGTLRIDGHVQGSVRVGTTVVVGKDGSVSGDVEAGDAVISGTVEGSLVAASRIEVHAHAHVEGDLRALSMQLEEGAVLNGTLSMGTAPARVARAAEARARPSGPTPLVEEGHGRGGPPRAAAS